MVQARSPINSCLVKTGLLGSAISKTPSFSLEDGEIPAIGQKAATKTWSDVVGKANVRSSRLLSYHPPTSTSTDGVLSVIPPNDMLRRGNQIWAASLVGYFLHSSLPFKVVEPIARRLWGHLGLFEVFLHNKGYYIFKFDSALECDHILASGPWHFTSKIMVLQKWKEGVEFSKTKCNTFPIWVKLSNIPLSYWSDEGISHITSSIGKPLFTDEITSKHDFWNFSRVCIEVKASFSFPPIRVATKQDEALEYSFTSVEVEYQSKPPTCPKCLVFGHSPLKCPKASYQWIPKAPRSDANDKMQSAFDGKTKMEKMANMQAIDGNCSTVVPKTGNATNKIITEGSSMNDWVTVGRGAKYGSVTPIRNNAMIISNTFAPMSQDD